MASLRPRCGRASSTTVTYDAGHGRFPRRNALVGIVIAVVLGALIATLGGDGGEEPGGLPVRLAGVHRLRRERRRLRAVVRRQDRALLRPHRIGQRHRYPRRPRQRDERDLRTWLFAVLIAMWAGRLGTFLPPGPRRRRRPLRQDQGRLPPVPHGVDGPGSVGHLTAGAPSPP